jgi:hypothetical protein
MRIRRLAYAGSDVRRHAALRSLLSPSSPSGNPPDLATTVHGQLCVSKREAAEGGEMLFKVACVLLILWLLGAVGVFRVGELVHVLLLIGLMLLLLAVLRARDAAARQNVSRPSDK